MRRSGADPQESIGPASDDWMPARILAQTHLGVDVSAVAVDCDLWPHVSRVWPPDFFLSGNKTVCLRCPVLLLDGIRGRGGFTGRLFGTRAVADCGVDVVLPRLCDVRGVIVVLRRALGAYRLWRPRFDRKMKRKGGSGGWTEAKQPVRGCGANDDRFAVIGPCVAQRRMWGTWGVTSPPAVVPQDGPQPS